MPEPSPFLSPFPFEGGVLRPFDPFKENDRFQHLKAKAESGDAAAQVELGDMYFFGRGISRNLSEGIRWWRKAAEHGDHHAQYNVGISYYRGDGLTKDPVQAAKWLRKAAEQDNVDAQFWLGFGYAGGEGVPKDEVRAYAWWLLAAAKGNKDAKKNIAIAEQRLTRSGIAEGQRLARNFKVRRSPRDDSSGADIARSQP
jgi:TPR repeat protein